MGDSLPTCLPLARIERRAARLLVLCSILIGCQGSPRAPEPSTEPFTGPPVTVDSSGPEHVLVAQLPNPGYRFTLDSTREEFNRRDVFATFRRPNPTVMYPQVVVEQRLATGVKSQTPITVYARVVEYDEDSPSVTHARAAQWPSPAHTEN